MSGQQCPSMGLYICFVLVLAYSLVIPSENSRSTGCHINIPPPLSFGIFKISFWECFYEQRSGHLYLFLGSYLTKFQN